MELNHIVAHQFPQRFRTANGEVTVRMRRIQQAEKCALRDRGWQVGQLTEAIEAQLANTLEIGVAHRRRGQHVGHERRTAFGKPCQRCQCKQGGVGANLHVVLRADASQRIGHIDSRPRTSPFVRHVRCNRGKPFASGWIRAKPTINLHDEGNQRYPRVLDSAHPQAIRQRVTDDFREAKLRIRAWRR